MATASVTIASRGSRGRRETATTSSVGIVVALASTTSSSSSSTTAALLLLLLTATLTSSTAFSFSLSSSSRTIPPTIAGLARTSGVRISPRRRPPPSTTATMVCGRGPGVSATSAASSSSQRDCSREKHDVVKLRYSEFPPPPSSSSARSAHPPVIFLHGLLGNKRNFASLASSLSSQLRNSRTIYTLDLRNHGENTHDWRMSMSYTEMARDVLAFMDDVMMASSSSSGNDRAVLVGHSMGGKVAQCLALMHPERVAGLVVLDIAPVRYKGGGGGGGDGSGWRAVEEIVRSVATIDLTERGSYATKRDVDKALRQRTATLEDPALRAFVLTNLEQVAARDRTRGAEDADDVVDDDAPTLRWKIHWDGIVNELDRIAGFDVHDRAMDDGAVASPPDADGVGIVPQQTNDGTNSIQYEGDVFFIHGGASRFVRHSHISTIASFFPNHMLTTIRGSGHWVHAEAPDDTIALLKRYLDR